LRDLVIYNGIQLLFVCLLFVISISIYRWAANKLAISKTARRGALVTISISWIIFSFLAYSMAWFFCCPGLFPEVANPYWWLTLVEFAVFAIAGSLHLIKNLGK
jgi:magnesium-transporting ATPase (P-type)